MFNLTDVPELSWKENISGLENFVVTGYIGQKFWHLSKMK